MTGIEFDKRVSMGNILTVGAVLVTVITGLVRMDASQTKLAEKIATIEANIAQKTISRDKQNDIMESRMRAVEIAQAGQSSDLRSIQIGISEIKAALGKINDVVRK